MPGIMAFVVQPLGCPEAIMRIAGDCHKRAQKTQKNDCISIFVTYVPFVAINLFIAQKPKPTEAATPLNSISS